ncbi:hypothetical protein [Massilia sp. Leaf139]|uniref:hypothetical protein n=1 Tax=Massilia sp. Leaf139 TaxID=1736272 RepID=UPI0007008D04|nr:hypothetical protein [Massilia sp. Leaf139]KQQ97410.1 hypothetical protein ASF77_05550 [Massilia sp. Leaf139]
MATNASAPQAPGSVPDAASTTMGIGGTTSGQAGATPAHETQQETGGSGGDQLTQSTGEIDEAQREAPAAAPDAALQPDDSAMQTGARGAFDTRAEQAGGTGTGLGTSESGANQSEKDLPPAR